jgi:hypothetical protein
MVKGARQGEPAGEAPNAWAVWESWQGNVGQVAEIARQIGDHLDGEECDIEVDVEGGQQRIRPDNLKDLGPRYLKAFRRMFIAGSTPGQRVEAEFDNERVRTPGRGIVLRVWSSDDAIALRDSLAVIIDGGRGALANKPTMGPPSEQAVDDALVSAEKTYRASVALAGCAAAFVTLFIVLGLHRIIEPQSDLGKILFFCVCGDRKIGVGLYLLLLGGLTFVAAPRLFPQIEISDRSRWSRTRRWLLGVAGSTVTLGSVLALIAQKL